MNLKLMVFLFLVNRVRAIVYQTYSKNAAENEQLVMNSIKELNEPSKSKTVFPFK